MMNTAQRLLGEWTKVLDRSPRGVRKMIRSMKRDAKHRKYRDDERRRIRKSNELLDCARCNGGPDPASINSSQPAAAE